MRKGVMLINTSRGALVDANAAVRALKSGILGHLGLDVYEEEGDLFFQDLSTTVIQDDVFMRLLTFPNVLITGHQAFFTREAVQNIAETTLGNIRLSNGERRQQRGDIRGDQGARNVVREPAARRCSWLSRTARGRIGETWRR